MRRADRPRRPEARAALACAGGLAIAGVGGVGVGGLGRAEAQEARVGRDDCAWLVVEDDAARLESFGSVLDGLCARAAAIEGRDPGATLTVGRAETGGLRVEATLRDGRRASRIVSESRALIAVVEALVVVPQTSTPPSEPRESADALGSAPEPASARVAPVSAAAAAAATSRVESLGTSTTASSIERGGLELALQGTLRFAGPPATGAPGVVAAASWVGSEGWTAGWLVGVRARVDGAVLDLERDAAPRAAAFGGGVEGARRFPLGDAIAIDAGLGVDVVAIVPLDADAPSPGERAPRRGADGDAQGRLFGRLWILGESASFCTTAAFTTSPAAWHDRPGDGDFGPVGAELGAGVAWGAP
jgi:hypothetical protein